MKCNGKFAHSLRLDFHMTQRILAPVRFLDGLTGYPSAVALFGLDAFSHAGIRRPCQYGSRGKSATASNLPPPVRIYAEWATPSNEARTDRKSTRLNSSHTVISYAVFCLK